MVDAGGRVIGVDVNDDMLQLARRYQADVGRKIGWENVSFHKARIQDLALDLEAFERQLQKNPIATSSDWLTAQQQACITIPDKRCIQCVANALPLAHIDPLYALTAQPSILDSAECKLRYLMHRIHN